jgi:hypothetical protein
VLDDVERRGFLVEPAREYPLHDIVRPLHVDLHERAGQLFLFPRCRHLAGAQVHHEVPPPGRLSRAHGNIANDAVALVEHAQNGDPLRHRGDARLRAGPDHRRRLGRSRRSIPLGRRVIAPAPGKAERKQQGGGNRAHHYSGVQGS